MSVQTSGTGFELRFAEYHTSDIGPAVLALFAFFIFAQGLMYLIRPENTGRAMTTPIEKIRRLGLIIVLLSAALLYGAFSWWVESWSQLPPVDPPRN